jgi:hypothetical protein
VGDVLDLIRRFVASGASFAAIDLPDRNATDARKRSYDTSVYTHLDFDADELLAEFPGAKIVRNDFPGYVNGKFRFNAFVLAR